MSQSAQNTIDLKTLPAQQLSALQQRLSQELEHLSTSYQRLRAAQSRFRDCIRSIQDGIQGKSGGIWPRDIVSLWLSPKFLLSLTPPRNEYRDTSLNPTDDLTIRSGNTREALRCWFRILSHVEKQSRRRNGTS